MPAHATAEANLVVVSAVVVLVSLALLEVAVATLAVELQAHGRATQHTVVVAEATTLASTKTTKAVPVKEMV